MINDHGTIRSIYMGRGEDAEHCAKMVEHRKADRVERKNHGEAVRTRIEADEKPIVRADAAAHQAYVAWRVSTGWYRHARGWRRTGRTTMRTLKHSEAEGISKALRNRKSTSRTLGVRRRCVYR